MNERKQKRALLSQKQEIMKLIPYEAVYEDGIVKTEEGMFSKAYRIEDTTYEDVKGISNEEISRRFDALIKEAAADFTFQFIVYNSLVDKDVFLRKIRLKEDAKRGYEKERDLYNRMLGENSGIGHNNVKKNRFFVISCRADTADEAKAAFSGREDDLESRFFDICRIKISPLSSMELLGIIYGMYNPHPSHKRGRRVIDDFASLSKIRQKKKTTKELVMPDSVKEADVDYMVLNDNTYVRCLFLCTVPVSVTANLVSDITNVSSNMIFSCIYEPMDTALATKIVREKVEDNTRVKRSRVTDTVKDRKLKITRATEEMIVAGEDGYFCRTALETLAGADLALVATYTVVLYADDLESLDRDTKLLEISASKFACNIKPLDLNQAKGLATSLPLCTNRIDCRRVFTSKKVSKMPPLCLSDEMQEDGVFCGLNAINDNLILLNRKNNPCLAGLIAGTEHSGKTFQAKREIVNALLSSDDEVVVVSSTDEYDGFVKRLGGSIGSKIFTNPFLVPEGYGLSSDKYSKCLFLEALARFAGDEAGAEFSDEEAGREAGEFYDILKTMGERNSLSVYRYLIEEHDRFPALSTVASHMYEYEQGHTYLLSDESRLKLVKTATPLEMLLALEQLYARNVMRTRWIFADNVDCFFMSDPGAGFFRDYIDNLNSKGMIFTGVIQSSARLFSDTESMYRLSDTVNSFGYHKLLNQGAKERKKYTEILNIPSPLINYITYAELGKGIILTPSSGVAFDDNFLSDDEDGESRRFYDLFAV